MIDDGLEPLTVFGETGPIGRGAEGHHDSPKSREFSVMSGRSVLSARRFGTGPTVLFLHPGVADQ